MADPQGTANAPLVADQTMSQRLGEMEFVLEFVEKSNQKRMPYVPIWDEVLANYMVRPYGMIGGYGSQFNLHHTRSGYDVPAGPRQRVRSRSILKDPETHQITETITSQAVGLLLGQRDYIGVIPTDSDDYDKARLVGKLLQAQMEGPGVWSTHYKLFKDAFLFGTAIIQIGWETRSRQQYVMTPRGLELQPVIYRDGPLQTPVDIYKFYPDPSGTSIQDNMIGVAKEFEITVHQARQLAKRDPETGERGVYDFDDVERAIKAMRSPTEGRGSTSKAKRFPEEQTKLPQKLEVMQGLEYWGFSPITASDGASNRVITLLNGIRVRSRPNGYIDGNVPFKEIVVNPISGRFYGLAPAEVIRFLQDSIDGLLMNLTDAADLAVRGPMLIGNAFGGNPDQMRNRALNDLILCSDVTQAKPYPVDLNSLQFSALDLIRRKQSAREATGATNPLQAIGGSAVKTATETSELVRLGTQRVEPMVLLIEKDAYPWIGKTLHSRNKQFLPPGGARVAIGDEVFDISLEDIEMEADVKFVGSRHAGSKFQKSMQYRRMAEVVGSERGKMLALLAPEILIRWFRDGEEIVDAEKIVSDMSDRALQLLRIEMGGGAGPQGGGQSSPGGAAGTGGVAPEPGQEANEDFGTQAGQTERDGQAVA